MSGSGDYKKFLEKVSLIVIQTSRIYLVCNKKNTFHSRRYFKNLTSTVIELVHLVTPEYVMCIYHLVQKEKNQRPKFKGRNVQGKYDFTKFTKKKNVGLRLFKNF